MDKVDKIFYINLEKRKDRKSEIINEFKKMQIPSSKIHRFPAIPSSPGNIGCALSHLNLLMFIKQKGYTNTIILEDDFEFIVSRKTLDNNLNNFFNHVPKYDIVMLSYSLLKTGRFNKVCGRVFNAQTTSGYMIHRDFLDKLIELWKKAIVKLIESNGRDNQYVCDISWKVLQPSTRWFYFRERLGQQRKSYSDIENHITEYGV